MSPRDLTPEQAALIDHRLDQAFAFIRDVIDDPVILEEIPGGSSLRFSDVTIGDVEVRLTAYPDEGPSWSWTACITGPVAWAAAGRNKVQSFAGEVGGEGDSPSSLPAHGNTAEEALLTLEEKLRAMPQQLGDNVRPERRTA